MCIRDSLISIRKVIVDFVNQPHRRFILVEIRIQLLSLIHILFLKELHASPGHHAHQADKPDNHGDQAGKPHAPVKDEEQSHRQ